MWTSEKTVVGWIVVFRTPAGDIWFRPDQFGNARGIFSIAVGLMFDLQQLAAIARRLKHSLRPAGDRYGTAGSDERGAFCSQLAAAMNEAKLFPERKDAA